MKPQNPFDIISTQLERVETKLDFIELRLQVQEPTKGNTLLTTDEVCKFLSVSRVTLWNWKKKGILKPIRIGNLLRYRTEDIEEMSKGN